MVSNLRDRAIDLRVSGLSRSQIKSALGVNSSKMLTAWLQGVPAPIWTQRPNAKDDLRALAVAMRLEGRSYNQIRQELGVSKSSLSLWLRDIPLTAEQTAAINSQATANRGAAIASRNQRRRDAITAVARDEITELSERELFIAGVVAYWAEGAKNKPGGTHPVQAKFINSDPSMIRLYLSWLALLGIGLDQVTFRVHIHESADVPAAEAFWTELVGIDRTTLKATTLKRHNPKTNRTNVGEHYRGRLCITVRRSADLNLMIAGWCAGLADAAGTMIRTRSGVV